MYVDDERGVKGSGSGRPGGIPTGGVGTPLYTVVVEVDGAVGVTCVV